MSLDPSKLSLYYLEHELGYTRQQVYDLLSNLSENDAKALLYDWRFWARPKQLPPEGDWRFWVLLCGRSFGKTRAGAEWIVERARQGKGPIALIGQSSGDVRDTMVELNESSIMKICPPDFMPEYEPTNRRLTFPNGVTATTFSGDKPGQLRGPQHQTIWCDELAKMQYPQETFDQLNMGLRIGDSRAIITTTPTPHDVIKWLWKRGQNPEDKKVVLVEGSTLENKDNVDAEYIDELEKTYRGTRMEKQEIFGQIIWESEDSLFRGDHIDANRIQPDSLETLTRIAIGVDPSVSDKEGSDSTGIVVCGLGERLSPDEPAHGYVLEDATLKGSPSQWAQRVALLFEQYRERFGVRPVICAEKNQGGDMVLSTLTQHGLNEADIKMVHASKGKLVRAEPISLLYEQGRIHHVGNGFATMEDQMVSYEGKPNQKSPDAMDAMVWGMTELMLGRKRHVTSTSFLL